ncbi:hypothetical protein COT72_03880 [archaeon CG10_big_fil_rev_8_21_14_0_10_43_11]|nr:MAG: hypothetical protein COT72_03880 [archaeon CG10_big_fil_rev_8_21_14_0_10_43_11]
MLNEFEVLLLAKREEHGFHVIGYALFSQNCHAGFVQDFLSIPKLDAIIKRLLFLEYLTVIPKERRSRVGKNAFGTLLFNAREQIAFERAKIGVMLIPENRLWTRFLAKDKKSFLFIKDPRHNASALLALKGFDNYHSMLKEELTALAKKGSIELLSHDEAREYVMRAQRHLL